ncbi:PilC/PilY family type IV pilus protein [Chitinivorax sp. B]|uniref:pilus assembly protein n=1 Tax=Chitinivorax sp. B TaxID=2502235 RepID=UPI0010F62395|nr:PilC/PilY family type IV pilus protein [Chitinivorax sp. B]
MKNSKAFFKVLSIAVGVSLIGVSGLSHAAVTLPDKPLLDPQLPKPNIFFILDDSGSMAWTEVPDTLQSYRYYNQYRNHLCNPLYFNPDFDYENNVPVQPDGTSYPVPLFTSAPNDGFASSSSKIDLRNAFKYMVHDNISGEAAHYYRRNDGVTTASCADNSKYTKVNVAASTDTLLKTRFAIWFSFYRTRMLAMKSGVGLAFDKLGADHRVGFSTIQYLANSGNALNESDRRFLGLNEFGQNSPNATYGVGGFRKEWYKRLYQGNPGGGTPLRVSLEKTGKMYAGQITPSSGDPIPEKQYCRRNYTILSTDGFWNSDNVSYGDVDGSAPLPFKDKLKTQNTLADVAMYYYNTDLRDGTKDARWANYKNDLQASVEDPAKHQHMVTFTIGLGVDGLLKFVPDYKTNTNSATNDYVNILNDSKSWPNPNANELAKVDDLWHAAVNGYGQYFSAKKPSDIIEGLTKALRNISDQARAGSGVNFPNPQLTPGDNFAYVAGYTPGWWSGEVEKREVDVATGEVSANPKWKATDKLVNVPYADRKIYTFSATAGDKLRLFSWGNLSLTEQGYFSLTKLSQCQGATAYAECKNATRSGADVVNFLRGDRTGENKTDKSVLFRERKSVLGDIIGGQPIYLRESPFAFTGGAFASRAARVYAASNDGMLHAFDASANPTLEGKEVWAYIPQLLLPNLHKLADINYEHQYYVDAMPTISDIYDGAWKSILVGGFNKGGKGYYALDISSADKPVALWEYQDADLGYSFGRPIITKIQDGATERWVVVISSGYNATKDKVVVLDAKTGTVIKQIPTGAVAGLAKLSGWVDDFDADNKTQFVYGGDLNGAMWRFDLQGGTAMKLIDLGSSQPITVKPELAEVNGKRVVYFGTGQLLAASDLTNLSTKHFLYGVADKDATTATTKLEKRTIAIDKLTLAGTVTGDPLDWNVRDGFYAELTYGGEKATIDPRIVSGTLVLWTNTPENLEPESCSGGGFTRAYFLDFKKGTGSSVKVVDSLSVSGAVVQTASGAVKGVGRTVDGKNPVIDIPIVGAGGKGRRVTWREVISQ